MFSKNIWRKWRGWALRTKNSKNDTSKQGAYLANDRIWHPLWELKNKALHFYRKNRGSDFERVYESTESIKIIERLKFQSFH